MSNRRSEIVTGVENTPGVRRDVWSKSDVFGQSDFPFRIMVEETPAPASLHMHTGFWELTIISRGECCHYTEDEEYLVRAGDVYVIKGDQKHGYRDSRNLYLTNICFDPQILTQTKHAKKLPGYHVLFNLEPRFRRDHRFESRLHLGPEETAHVMSIINLMRSEMSTKSPGYEYTIIALFMQVISFMCRCYARTMHAPHSLMDMAKVISHLEANYANPINLGELADLIHMSPSTLLRHFKKATGFSPVDYLLRVRISRAIELLRNEDMTVIEAAFAVGFSDSNYFARQFKRIMKLSPSEYRIRMHTLI